MLPANRIALSLRASKPCASRLRQDKIASTLFESSLAASKIRRVASARAVLAQTPLIGWPADNRLSLGEARFPLQPSAQASAALPPLRRQGSCSSPHPRPWRIDSASRRQETARSRWLPRRSSTATSNTAATADSIAHLTRN